MTHDKTPTGCAARVLEAIRNGAANGQQISTATGLNERDVRSYMTRLFAGL